jgi:hypothetical protein
MDRAKKAMRRPSSLNAGSFLDRQRSVRILLRSHYQKIFSRSYIWMPLNGFDYTTDGQMCELLAVSHSMDFRKRNASHLLTESNERQAA